MVRLPSPMTERKFAPTITNEVEGVGLGSAGKGRGDVVPNWGEEGGVRGGTLGGFWHFLSQFPQQCPPEQFRP